MYIRTSSRHQGVFYWQPPEQRELVHDAIIFFDKDQDHPTYVFVDADFEKGSIPRKRENEEVKQPRKDSPYRRGKGKNTTAG